MTVESPQEIAWTTARPEDNASFVAFVDACFGRPAGRSLRREFPTALAPSNAALQLEGRIEGERVCAATALVRPWRTSAGPIPVACVGCFSTAPAWRGQGLSAALQDVLLERLREGGVAWAALWTDRPELYAGRGFRAVGSEVHGRLDAVRWPGTGAGESVRRASIEDAEAIAGLYGAHELRADREVEDFRAYLDPSTSRTWILEREGAAIAYASLGKGEDFPGYVHDYGGEIEPVHTLWGVAVAAGATAVLLPEGSDRYRSGRASVIPTWMRPAAYVSSLAPTPPPSETAFAVWGFDSA